MNKKLKQFLFLINAMFFLGIIFLYNNSLDLKIMIVLLCIFWAIIMWRMYHKYTKIHVDILIYALIVILNASLYLNLPRFTYYEAVTIVLAEYRKNEANTDIISKDNKMAKQFNSQIYTHSIFEYRMYTIVVTDGSREWFISFDSYSGNFEEITPV